MAEIFWDSFWRGMLWAFFMIFVVLPTFTAFYLLLVRFMVFVSHRSWDKRQRAYAAVYEQGQEAQTQYPGL